MNRRGVGEVRKQTDVPLHYPPFKVRHHDARRPPGGCQVCSSKWNGVEDGCVDMACCTGVFAVEQRYLRLCMDMCVHLPLIVTLVITLELEQVLQAV
jgi:hypothetical protein